jgi:hypothetical protein
MGIAFRDARILEEPLSAGVLPAVAAYDLRRLSLAGDR